MLSKLKSIEGIEDIYKPTFLGNHFKISSFTYLKNSISMHYLLTCVILFAVRYKYRKFGTLRNVCL